jgi:carbon monoxide dehydrogenase subunit G
MSGEYRIPAPRDKVWQALNDPEILKQAIPGCEELIKTSDTDLEAKVTAKVGPVKAKFGGKVRLENINAPESYSIVGEGKGGAAGFAKGGADVHLREDGSDTILTYNAKAEVGGKLAQIGSRLVQGAAKKTADDFFGKFSQIVGEGHAATAAAAPAGPVGEPAPAAAPAAAEPAPAAPPSGMATGKVAEKAPPAAPPSKPAAPEPSPAKSRLGGLGMPAYIGIGVVVLILLYLIFS